ncbi:hypothetical protein [Streptomyces sp. NPDC058092]|uniref:hypothetical protein n=1 Tax=Streptomyces sp. NPDC058092 TaxID=3346336 RepID=UPI0036E2BBEC
MSEWVSAAIGAGSAVVGGIVTGWFTRSAGHRQADAAKHAGDRQADALIATVQETLEEQRAQSRWEARRNVYVQFLDAVGSVASRGPITGQPEPVSGMRAYLLLELEGPEEVVRCGRALVESASWSSRLVQDGSDAFAEARAAFIRAAQVAIAR